MLISLFSFVRPCYSGEVFLSFFYMKMIFLMVDKELALQASSSS